MQSFAESSHNSRPFVATRHPNRYLMADVVATLAVGGILFILHEAGAAVSRQLRMQQALSAN